MNLFAFSFIVILVANISTVIFVIFTGKDKKLKYVWAWFCTATSIWGLCGYFFATTPYKEVAFLWRRIANISVILAPIAYYHFVYIYVRPKNKHQRYILFSAYIFGFIFLILNFFFPKHIFVGELQYVYNQFWYADWWICKSPAYLLFYIYTYWLLLGYSFVLLIKAYKTCAKNLKNQIKYFILASSIGWIGAEATWLTEFRIYIYPYSNFLIGLYTVIMTYAMVRHHLIDINIAIKKGVVYSSLVALITAFYLMFVLIITKIFQGLAGYQSFIVNLFAIFVIALVFNPLRNRIQRFLDLRFFKGTLESYAAEQERLKERLFNTEKLAYVGQLASEVAHEIRNPLTAIKTYVEYLPAKYNTDPEFKDKFDRLIPKEIERINSVLNQLLDLAKPRNPEFRKIDLLFVINTTLRLLENNLKNKKIDVKKAYKIDEAIIQADGEQLRQVFLNLFVNAIDAMEEGGTLTIEISISSNSSKDISGHSRLNKFAEIRVKDNGKGIPEENLKKLFTPFFTTKKNGVGLGLIISREIITLHNGTIKVESKVGEGTTFILRFPVCKR